MRYATPRDLGALVREARTSAGLSQTALGDKMGASRFWVAEFERGKAGAELGLALKALRALKLMLTVEPEDVVRRRHLKARQRRPRESRVVVPMVDLSEILDGCTGPLRRDPFAEKGGP